MTGVLSMFKGAVHHVVDYAYHLNMFEWFVASIAMVVGGILVSTLQIDFTIFAHMMLIISTISSLVITPFIFYYYRVHDRLLILGMSSLLVTNLLHILAGSKMWLNLAPIADIFLSLMTICLLAVGYRLCKCSCLGSCNACDLKPLRRKSDTEVEHGD